MALTKITSDILADEFNSSNTLTAGATVTLTIFLLGGVILGENNGAFFINIRTIFGNAIWTLLFSSILLPGLIKLRRFTLTSRERI